MAQQLHQEFKVQSLCESLHGVTQFKEAQSPMSFSLLRSTSSCISGSVGIAADHHLQQVCTHLGTIHPPPAWLCLFGTLSVILAEVDLGKEADWLLDW